MSKDKLKIKVSIADRVYPLTIERSEEERVRKAVSMIASAMSRFEDKYAVNDKQDALAMCALQVANQMLGSVAASKAPKEGLNEDTLDRLRSMETQLQAVLGDDPAVSD
ncbi:MAG: cell division protein ZapA [Bacteroidetes bacterium]|nr:cell division protein ZapA [Bacteroidota bacterium]